MNALMVVANNFNDNNVSVQIQSQPEKSNERELRMMTDSHLGQGDVADDRLSLLGNEGLRDIAEPTVVIEDRATIGPKRSYLIVFVLVVVNLLNYMDRFTVAGVLNDIKVDFGNISDEKAGLLQTSFIITYMLASPVVGYLGDRFTRKYIMVFGIFFWSAITFSSSFIPKNMFAVFVIFRGLVGLGEASYSTIAPTIIADLYTDDKRKLMLMCFYFAIPVGSGLGYVIGSNVAKLFHDWRYGLRVTPFLGIVCLVLIIFLVREPHRGAAEGGDHVKNTTYLQDLKALVKNKSFMLSTGGFTCVAFVTGALTFWAPIFMIYAHDVQNNIIYGSKHVQSLQARIGLIFGGITVGAGFIGVALGSEGARRYKKINPCADPLVCAFGMISCTPFLFFSLYLAGYSSVGTWVLIFFGETLLCLNWAVVADILLYVVIPTRRSTAEAFQILMSHLLGDAGSPFLIGWISDTMKPSFHSQTQFTNFFTLQFAMYLTAFVCLLGGVLFLTTSCFIEKDKNRVLKIVHESQVLDSDRELAG